MSEELFRRSEAELDTLLDAARDELSRRDVTIADGSAREALVWAYSFSIERTLGEEHQRIACTLTLRDDSALLMQSLATGSRASHREDPRQIAWSDLRRRGLAPMIEETLATAQFRLQVRTGVEYAHEELIRRCDSLIELIGNDIPQYEALRKQVMTWRTLAEQRALYSPARPSLTSHLSFDHLEPEVQSLSEFYAAHIYAPLLNKPAPGSAEVSYPPPVKRAEETSAIPRRIPIQLPKVEEVPGGETSMLIIGIFILLVAVALLGFAIVRHSWPFIAGSAIFVLLVVRALWQWHR